MYKHLKILYCTIFFALILAPLLFMPWSDNQSAENRLPAPPPQLIVDGAVNLSAPLEAEEFLKDRFAGRVQMIDIYNRLVYNVFGISANDKVVAGKDGWLFFAETLGDYDGSAALDDAQMAQLTNELLEMMYTFEARGQAFIIAIAPNKNTLYGEYMPGGYKKTQTPTNLERLLANDELECIDLGATLLAAERETGKVVYHKTDSHWNGIGARAVAGEILAAVEEKTGVRIDNKYDPGDEFVIGLTLGDLAQMLFPLGAQQEEQYVYSDALQGYTTVGRYRGPDDLNITTKSDGTPLRIAVYRDSFANSLIPYISSAFGDVFYTRQTPPPLDSGPFVSADVIIFEIVERRLGELLGAETTAP